MSSDLAILSESLTERQQIILWTVVERYLQSGVPVASHDVVASAAQRFSASTVRQEYGALERQGYLHKPHAAAGRLPTDAAISAYAQRLAGHTDLSLEQQYTIEQALSAIRHEVESLLQETTQLLFERTQCVGVVVAPKEQWGHIEAVRLAPLEGEGLLVALVFSWGHVESITTVLPRESTRLDLSQVERALQQELVGRNIYDLDPVQIEAIFGRVKQRSLAHRLVCEPLERLMEELASSRRTKVVATGVVTLADHPAFDGQEQLRMLLRLARDPSYTPRLFFDIHPASPGVRIRIGREIGGEEFAGLASIWAPFGRGDALGGKVGIFGPLRLPYAQAIPLVAYCAQLLERSMPTPRLVN